MQAAVDQSLSDKERGTLSHEIHIATTSSEGQVLIPKAVRDEHSLAVGNKINFAGSPCGSEIVPHRQSVLSLYGKYAHLVKNRRSLADIDAAVGRCVKKRFGP